MRVLCFGEENSVSDLTPDGDLISNAKVAIRYFHTGRAPQISVQEASMLRGWAKGCHDATNGERLKRLLNSLPVKG